MKNYRQNLEAELIAMIASIVGAFVLIGGALWVLAFCVRELIKH